ncbi:hypothetical protein [Bordetella sp. 15P40C-2]|uniref:hypothetical protein n=1 Tax=Bordetella sp. 15P40C-2 TaxID=2572246 RepID=UPI001329ADF5|nr:hypothetical protein [Bordetella sp. 15P40C-2]MVW70466.1 hypothetical protein [Bordetella sp. 15P40C-2]
MNFSPVSPLSPVPSLETYTEAAKDGQDLYVNIDGKQRQVLSWGKTPNGRSVAWLEPDVDTTSMFTQALAQVYGAGIASAVSRQLGLQPAPGKPISARVVMSAVDMAKTAKDAMTGVDFLSRLSASAVADTPVFRQACKDCQVNPATLSAAQRAALDNAMETRFEAAARAGGSPVSLQTAAQWLRELLQSGIQH